MATTSRPTSSSTPTTDAAPEPTARRTRWVLPVSLLAVAVAFGATVVRVLSGLDDSFRYAGDQAVFGLAVQEASTFDRDLGPYSRYGWSHPGPLWFYLLAPATRVFGGDDAALVAANVLLNGLLAAAVVVAVHRAGRPALTLAVTGLVLLLVLRMPASFFVQLWSPFALLMGTLLFLVLAARVHSGSWPALLAMAIAGSFLVQTHVGTAPLVGLVGIAGVVAFVLARRAARRAAADPAARATSRRGLTAVLGALLVTVWIPPLLQQLTSPFEDGNIGRLVHFFLFGDGEGVRPTPFQAVIAVGRLLAMTPYGWDTGPYEMDVSVLPASVALAFFAQGLASVALVVLGRRWGSRSALWSGVVTLVALVAAVASASTVTGPLYWYLVLWVSVLPVATLIGFAHLLLDRRDPRRTSAPEKALLAGTALLDRLPVLAAVAVVVLAGSVAAAVSLGGAVPGLPASPGVAAASDLVDDALEDVEGRAVYVDIATNDLWPIGAGVVQGLVADGWTVTVDQDSRDLFGPDRVGDGSEPVDVVLVSTDDPALLELRRAGGITDLGTVDTELGPTSVLVRIDD